MPTMAVCLFFPCKESLVSKGLRSPGFKVTLNVSNLLNTKTLILEKCQHSLAICTNKDWAFHPYLIQCFTILVSNRNIWDPFQEKQVYTGFYTELNLDKDLLFRTTKQMNEHCQLYTMYVELQYRRLGKIFNPFKLNFSYCLFKFIHHVKFYYNKD